VTDREPNYRELLGEAFNVKVPIPLLGGVPLNWLGLGVFGVLGLINPGFWAVGAALELALLFGLAQHPRFRNYVKGRRIQLAKQADASSWREQAEVALRALPDVDVARYRELVSRCERVAQISAADDELLGTMAEDGLERLQRIFLRLLQSNHALETQIDRESSEALRRELDDKVRQLEGYEGGDPRITKSMESTIDILRRRLINLDGADANVLYIQNELRRIEHQAELLIEEAALARGPDELASRIDAVTATFDETQAWMRSNHELLGEVERELDTPVRVPPELRQGVKP
jgi:hypothetical protein